MNNLKITQGIIKEKIIDPCPVEQDVAILLFLYGITEDEFSKMKDKLKISNPILLKIQNYLRDEWCL